MTRHRLALIGYALVAASVCSAAQADQRVADRPYRANEIVTLRGGPGIESTIAFAADERIENVAVGDSVAWQVTPNKRANLLFLKPANARARTNMTVVTDQRTYLFDLVSGPAGSAVYMLRFQYPDAPKPMETGQQLTVKLVAEPSPPAPPDPAARPAEINFAWRAKGEKSLLPKMFFDDGRSTFLRWNEEDVLPAILTRGPNGAEGPVNYTVRGEYIVVDGVPNQLVLRSGKHVATLTQQLRSAARPRATASAEQRDPPGNEAKP